MKQHNKQTQKQQCEEQRSKETVKEMKQKHEKHETLIRKTKKKYHFYVAKIHNKQRSKNIKISGAKKP